MLYVADAYYGLHTVNVTTGKVTRILTSKKMIGDRKPKFLDDLVINEDESAIYFTDASDKWDVKNGRNAFVVTILLFLMLMIMKTSILYRRRTRRKWTSHQI